MLGYLAKTLDYCIKYEGIENGKTGVEAIGYLTGSCPQCQTSVALSSMESEYMAASAAAQEAIWLNRLLEEMGFCSKKPIVLYEDNKAEILFSDHPGDHRRSKHIDTRKYFLRDAVINGEIKLAYINTSDQLADGLTKALTPEHHL